MQADISESKTYRFNIDLPLLTTAVVPMIFIPTISNFWCKKRNIHKEVQTLYFELLLKIINAVYKSQSEFCWLLHHA